MMPKTVKTATPDCIRLGSDWETICRKVSVSLVKWLMVSPCLCVSKYDTGKFCMPSNMARRNLYKNPCVIYAINWVYTIAEIMEIT